MGNPLIAKNAKVAIGGNQINGMGTFSFTPFDTDEVETTQFGKTWREFEDTMQAGGDFSFNGWFDKSDTSGVDALRSAALAKTGLTDLRFYIDSSSYYAPNRTGDPANSYAKIRSITVDAEFNTTVNITFTGRVYGHLTLV